MLGACEAGGSWLCTELICVCISVSTRSGSSFSRRWAVIVLSPVMLVLVR